MLPCLAACNSERRIVIKNSRSKQQASKQTNKQMSSERLRREMNEWMNEWKRHKQVNKQQSNLPFCFYYASLFAAASYSTLPSLYDANQASLWLVLKMQLEWWLQILACCVCARCLRCLLVVYKLVVDGKGDCKAERNSMLPSIRQSTQRCKLKVEARLKESQLAGESGHRRNDDRPFCWYAANSGFRIAHCASRHY